MPVSPHPHPGNLPPVPRSNYEAPTIQLPPGRYRVSGFVPMTGLHLDKWIAVTQENDPGCYGPANIAIARSIPNLARIEDEAGRLCWSSPSR